MKKWNGPEVSKPSKEYARELMWNASGLVYELGPEYFLKSANHNGVNIGQKEL